MGKKYTEAELTIALDLVESGYSFSEVANEMGLNKSIVAREMRKRKNSKGDQHIDEYRKSLLEETYRLYDKFKK